MAGRAHVGEPDVTIWPHEIDRIPHQAGTGALIVPRPRVERQRAFLTDRLDRASGITIDVNLPVERRQRPEVVVAVRQ